MMLSGFVAIAAPEGRHGNSPALQCREAWTTRVSPGGTAETSFGISAVPPGLADGGVRVPGTEVPGYFHSVPVGRFLERIDQSSMRIVVP
jgi:hypothetical protein